ncbi:MAG: ParA family partition ATPase [Acidobacteriota bacterium]
MTAKIVTVFNQKGGSGKSTITMQLAGTMAHRGYQTLVVDMDPQGTSSRWASAAEDDHPFPASVMSLAAMGGKMHREVKNHVDHYDVIFIDCPPSIDSQAPSSAMLISDLALIPVVPSPADSWATVAAKQLVEQARIHNEDLQARIVANMVQSNSKLAKAILEVLAEDEDCPMLQAQLGSRSAFRECQLRGGTVHSVPASLSKSAVEETETLTNEVLAILSLKPTKKGSKK